MYLLPLILIDNGRYNIFMSVLFLFGKILSDAIDFIVVGLVINHRTYVKLVFKNSLNSFVIPQVPSAYFWLVIT